MNLKSKRRMAAQIMKCGLGRVWMNPESEEDINQAITKEDIRGLISNGVIRLKQEKGVSRGRIRENAGQKRKGLRRGHGSRKGKAGARENPKKVWMARIRDLRAMFVRLKEKDIITKETYSLMRAKSKGGLFRSKRHAVLYLEEHNLLNKANMDKINLGKTANKATSFNNKIVNGISSNKNVDNMVNDKNSDNINKIKKDKI